MDTLPEKDMTQDLDVAGRTGSKEIPVFLHMALFFLLICINALVAKFVVFSFEMAPGASSFYAVVAVMIITTLWFGMYGAVAAYAGCFIGAGILSGLSPEVSLFWSLADFWQVLIPLIAFRVFRADPSLWSARDMGILVVFGIILNNLAGALWGSLTLASMGAVPWGNFSSVFFGWLIGNFIVCIALVPVALHFLTPLVRDHELFIRNYWN